MTIKITKEAVMASLEVLNSKRLAMGEASRSDSVVTHNIVTLCTQFTEDELRLACALVGNIARAVWEMEQEKKNETAI